MSHTDTAIAHRHMAALLARVLVETGRLCEARGTRLESAAEQSKDPALRTPARWRSAKARPVRRAPWCRQVAHG